jgi:hypothetical protein
MSDLLTFPNRIFIFFKLFFKNYLMSTTERRILMKEATQEELEEFLGVINRNDDDRVIELAAQNPAFLTKRTIEGDNCWIIVGHLPKIEKNTIEAVAVAAFRNLKNIPGGYDSFFFAQDVEGNTAVQIAAKARQNAHAQLLVNTYETLLIKKAKLPEAEVQKRVADLMNMPDSNGRTVFHNFLVERDAAKTLGLIQFFASKGADFNALDKDGNNPGHVHCKFLLEAAVNHSRTHSAIAAAQLITMFVEDGANPDQRNKNGETLISIGQKNSTGWTVEHTNALREIYQEWRQKKTQGQQAPVSSRSSSRQDESPSSSRSESTPPSSGKSTPPSSSRSESTPPPVVGPRTAALEKEKAQKQDQVGKSGCCSIL